MPRCYMVKKACNKYQTTVRDCWRVAAATQDEDREEAPAGPVSPTEGCVAPPSPGAYYRPLATITTQHRSLCFWTLAILSEIAQVSKMLRYKSTVIKLLKTALPIWNNWLCFFPHCYSRAKTDPVS
ncbi:hypothetical protein Cfor_02540 [Coptotermes formosanus]|uniref:Uncharacterized protein n=1 Tax=Coptotermes formosanus TaxID=36987 RepID=A0A6L2PMT2_COPFO|nr:hypothetical protein Cfor_02540 [Coptotermes formosanus]